MPRMSRFKSLRAWLRATHMTQSKFAQEMGVSNACISAIVNGTQEPGYRLALRIRERTGLPLTVLKPEPKPEPVQQPEAVSQ